MSKTNIENFNVTFNFFDYDISGQEEGPIDPVNSYEPIVLQNGIIAWTTKKSLDDQLRSLTVNDKVMLQPVDGKGEMDFSKTPMTFIVHEKAEQSLLLISEDVLFNYPMHKGGIVSCFEESSLYKYLNTEFKHVLPQDIQDLLVGSIQVPTAGMVFGQDDDWCNEHFIMDPHKQLQLMKRCKNRIAVDRYDNLRWWWLSNKAEKDFSASYFAAVDNAGCVDSIIASNPRGVRPAFQIRCKRGCKIEGMLDY